MFILSEDIFLKLNELSRLESAFLLLLLILIILYVFYNLNKKFPNGEDDSDV